MEKELHFSDMHEYQKRACNHQVANPRSSLWLFMGAGKTPITLTTFAHLQRWQAVRAALVLAPKRVAESGWESEARKWSHLQHLKFSRILGNPGQRLRALAKPADVYLMNYENVQWLVVQLVHYYINRGAPLPFDMLVLDESTKMKNASSKRVLALQPLLPHFHYRTALTGTPASNGLADLFGQYLCLDDGQRLGGNYNDFLNTYFQTVGFGGYKYEPTEEGELWIQRQVSDITIEMNQQDYLELPDLMINDLYVDLPSSKRRGYEELERSLFTELDNGVDLEVMSESSKGNKLLQYSNGAAYTNTETKEWSPIHDAKLEALEDIIEEASGEPVLVAYNYVPDATRILQKFPFAKTLTGISAKEFNQTLEEWREGKLRMLIGHPASMGHGVDGLQDRGHILVWFGLNWSLELYLQFNARLHRQGQGAPVVCHRILTRDTFDEVVRLALENKTQTQDTLRAAVAEYRARKHAQQPTEE